MAVYRVRLAEWRAAHGTWIGAWLLFEVLVPAALAIMDMMVPALVVLGFGLVPAVVVLVQQWSRASDSYWEAYASARGLRVSETEHLAANVPLLRKGDKREVERTVRGPIGTGEGAIALYTYTEVTTDSEGRRQETDYDYTIVAYELPPAVAARFRGVYLRRSGLTLGALQDRFGHDRAVELESVEFNRCFDLRAVDEQDDIALYELFSPTFIDFVCRVKELGWEQVGASLVVFQKGHCQDTSELDALCGKAACVFRRYSEEHR